jgi:hypothetical protein
MILALNRLCDRVSLKSQRADILQHTPTLLEAEVEAGKHDFTLGIEGISERQRAFLHKSLSSSELKPLIERMLRQSIRRLKLFYILTGHETENDIAEFREFARWLKETRRAQAKRPRIIFSVGLLIRMPFTPLRHDRLMLDQAEWKSIVGHVKSACETNGFEFRMAYDWPTYCTTQVLALGGYWLLEPLVALAEDGHLFDGSLSPGYWNALQSWMKKTQKWNDAFLGEKGPEYDFPLSFVQQGISPGFLYKQYQEAQAGTDGGYCLGSHSQKGRCLGCDACADGEQRRAITHHKIHRPERSEYLSRLSDVMKHKRGLRPSYARVHLAPWLAGLQPACLNAFVFRELLARWPEMADNLFSVRESLFSIKPNDRRFPCIGGETVFAFKAQDAQSLWRALADTKPLTEERCTILGPAEGFVPGKFSRLHLDLSLPADFFPSPRVRLEEYLRSAYLPYSLRREGDGYRFVLPKKALKKKLVYQGYIEEQERGFAASLDVGARFDLSALIASFGSPELARQIRARVSAVEW